MPLNAENLHSALEPEFIRFSSRRSVVYGTDGIVACTQPLAAQAGIKILHEGGNAAVRFFTSLGYRCANILKDAAVAVGMSAIMRCVKYISLCLPT